MFKELASIIKEAKDNTLLSFDDTNVEGDYYLFNTTLNGDNDSSDEKGDQTIK